MTPQEAYKLLEVSSDISDEDLKKIYKNLARKYHPDIYKEDPEKFKQINEAYQLIIDYRANPNKYDKSTQGFWDGVVDIGEIIFGGFKQNRQAPIQAAHINLKLNLTFHEAVQGCSKEISYDRNIKCTTCDGMSEKYVGNGCDKCNGFGQVINQTKGMVFQTSCLKCHGKGIKSIKCETCKGKRVVEDKRNGHINVPPGSTDGGILRMVGAGHFVGKSFFSDAYTDVNIILNVDKYKNMTLLDNDVCSTYYISLLEALEGTNKEVETVYGNKQITIKPRSKHADQIKIPNCGVKNTDGAHIITLDVEYPKDASKLIETLKNNEQA